VKDIQDNWSSETGQAAFPKLHMLRHSLEFAERYRFLGRASESQIESFHATFNALFHKQHRNQFELGQNVEVFQETSMSLGNVDVFGRFLIVVVRVFDFGLLHSPQLKWPQSSEAS